MTTPKQMVSGDVATRSTPSTPWGWLTLCTAGLVAAAFIYYWVIWRSWHNFVGGLDDTPVLFCDFVRHYYTTARQILTTATPSPGYYYSTFFAIILIPFGRLSEDAAVWLWGATQILTAVLLAALAGRHLLARGRDCYGLHLLLFLLCLPVLSNFKWGQVSLLMVLCAAAALYSYQANRKVMAGVVLALGAAIKYYPGLFIIYFLFKRDVRVVASFAIAVALFSVGVPWAVLGADRSHEFQYGVNRTVGAARDVLFRDINSQYFANVIYRQTQRGAKEVSPLQLPDPGKKNTLGLFFDALKGQLPGRPGPLFYRLRYTGYGLFAFNLLALAFLIRARPRDEAPLAFALLFLSLPLIVETSWPHYFVYLPLCQVILYAAVRDGPRLWAKVLAIPLLAASMVLSSTVFFHILGDWRVYSRYGMLFAADALLLVTLHLHLLALWLARRTTRTMPAPHALAAAQPASVPSGC
jgi:hypothetical protein